MSSLKVSIKLLTLVRLIPLHNSADVAGLESQVGYRKECLKYEKLLSGAVV